VSGTRYLIVVGVCLGVIGFMSWWGRKDLRLATGHLLTQGRVVRVHQPPPGRVRASDYQVEYQFEDEAGTIWSGSDVLPPRSPPPGAGEIEVAYRPSDPSVSRIASQVSGTPVVAVVFGVSTIAWATIRFLRGRRTPGTPLAAGQEESLPVGRQGTG